MLLGVSRACGCARRFSLGVGAGRPAIGRAPCLRWTQHAVQMELRSGSPGAVHSCGGSSS